MKAAPSLHLTEWETAPKSAPPLPGASRLMLLLAFAWPWQALQILPALNMYLDMLLTLGIILFCLASLWRERCCLGRFDLLWPALGLVVGIMFLRPANWGHLLLVLLLFLAVLQLRPGRALVLRCFWLSLLAGAGAALITVLGNGVGMFPTDFQVDAQVLSLSANIIHGSEFGTFLADSQADTSAVTYSAYSLNDALWLHGFGMILGLALTMALGRGGEGALGKSWALRAMALFCTICHALALYTGFETTTLVGLPQPAALPWPILLLLLLALYLPARIAAKMLISYKLDFQGLQPIFLLLLGLGTLATLLLGRLPGIEGALLLGWSAAYAEPGKPRPDSVGTRLAYLPLLMLPLILWNLLFVSEQNTRDPRHYAARYQQDLATGQSEHAKARLLYLHHHFPEERRCAWLLALHSLQEEAPEAASRYLSRAATPGTQRYLLSPPGSNAMESALVRLRDALSGLAPESRGLAYERALMGMGRSNDAWASLRLRAEALRTAPFPATLDQPSQQDILRRSLQNAFRDQLGAGEEVSMPDWDAAQWLAAFEVVGGRRVATPWHEGIRSPLLLWWQLTSESHRLDLYPLGERRKYQRPVTDEYQVLKAPPTLQSLESGNMLVLQLSTPTEAAIATLAIPQSESTIFLDMQPVAPATGDWLQQGWLCYPAE